MLALRLSTPTSWVACVLANFDAFLLDHAACERKASATGMAFVVRYPDRPELVDEMIGFAREELEHFHRVFRIVTARGLTLEPDREDAYLKHLLALVRTGREARLLDRLLVAGIVEARGCERFGLVADAIDDDDLSALYAELVQSEARHHGLFQRMARRYFTADEVEQRLDQLLDGEADLVRSLPITARLH